MAALIKRKGGAHQNAVLCAGDAVQQRCDVAVVAQIIGRTAKNGDGGGGREFKRLRAGVGEGDAH